MPIYVDDNGKVIVEFGGDIFIEAGTLHDHGVARFIQGSPGEIGRNTIDIKVDENPGVVFVAKDHRSLDVIIRCLTKVRDKMVEADSDSDVSG